MDISPVELMAETRALSALLRAESADRGIWSASRSPEIGSDHLRRLGITRVGSLTGLDTIGIPVFFACRPNSRSLSVSQGKGMDVQSARIGAIMEAAEHAFSGEAGQLATAERSQRELHNLRRRYLSPNALLPGAGESEPDRRMRWLPGISLFSGDEILVPLGAVGFDLRIEGDAERRGFSASTVGLAAAFTLVEACLHATLEMIENDATAMIDFLGRLPGLARPLTYASGSSEPLDNLIEKLGRAGLVLQLVSIDSPSGFPVVGAFVRPAADVPAEPGMRTFAGFACRLTPEAAAIAAALEAIQSRSTAIAGARDDLQSSDYEGSHPLLEQPFGTAMELGQMPGAPADALTSPEAQLRYVLARTRAGSASDVIAVPLGGLSSGLRVVRIVAPVLQSASGRDTVRIGVSMLEAIVAAAASR